MRLKLSHVANAAYLRIILSAVIRWPFHYAEELRAMRLLLVVTYE
jgi:hypothetical protein